MTNKLIERLQEEEAAKTKTCACIGCNNLAIRTYGGRPHCYDCLPPMLQNGKHTNSLTFIILE